MRKSALLFGLILSGFVSLPAQAFIREDGACEVQVKGHKKEGEIADCDVSIENNTLVINYDNYEELSFNIPVEKISKMFAQTYTLSRQIGGRGERRRTGIALDYMDEQNQFRVMILEFRSRNAFKFMHRLREVAGPQGINFRY